MGTPLYTQLKRTRASFLFAFKTYSCVICFTFLALVLNACIFKVMPFPCWVPEGGHWKTGMIMFQLIALPYPVFIVMCFDLMFTSSYMEVYFQFKLINKRFSELKTIRDIDKCQIHQHFLFE